MRGFGLALLTVCCGSVVGCAASSNSNGNNDLSHSASDFSIPGGFDLAGADLSGSDLSGGCSGKDLMNDSANCGRCGRSCGVGVCTMGACPVATLYPNEIAPVGLAIDTTSLYWTAGLGVAGYINKGLIGGGITPSTIDSSLEYVGGISAAGTAVVWAVGGAADGTGKVRISKSGGAAADLVTNENSPRGIYTDGTTVYWTNSGTSVGSNLDGALRRSPVTSPAAVNVGGATGLKDAGIVFLQGTNLFFTEQGTNGTSSTDGKVNKILANATGSTAPTNLAMNQASPFGIAADATNVYWLTNAAVMKQAQTGGTATPFEASQTGGEHILVDTTGVYWTLAGTSDGNGGFTGGKVMYAPFTGGTPIAFATNQKGPIKLIADSTSIYWTNIGTGPAFTDGSICKTVK